MKSSRNVLHIMIYPVSAEGRLRQNKYCYLLNKNESWYIILASEASRTANLIKFKVGVIDGETSGMQVRK